MAAEAGYSVAIWNIKNKESIYDADNGAVLNISKAYPVKGSNPFIPDAKCNIGKLSGSQQNIILPNAQEIATIPNDQETNPVDEVQSPELNEALLALSNSENKLQLEQIHGPCDIIPERCVDSYPENNWSKQHQNINSKQTHLCLQRLADAGAVVCVDYKCNLSYRNPSKWRKTAATSGTGNTNLPSVSHKLVDAIRSLMERPNGGYSLERALQFLSDLTGSPKSIPKLTGATLRVCLDRQTTLGKLAKTSDGRYILDETGEHKKAYMNGSNMHTPLLSNKKLLPPNTLSVAYQTSNGSCTKVTSESGPVDRNITPTRLHPLAAKQTSNTTNGKPVNSSLTPNFSMPPLSFGERGRSPGSEAKKISSEINPCEKNKS
ncbi:unnamed protein product [Schistosoma margrebowiei]|uniref:SAMD1-like winged helix (WH) domain-containing protein n=1 Tax=Schistosoma margrebowiei TaxID=48269 RepID=A0A183N7V9_9TREM|nr:unnamed protein product [Schistosoma margrebowiei]